ncbi:MAG: SUMF1/EgtB/PvdO family nonheme iron enzyme [Anaerolineales bacterium]|nr:SUMF1/EgtB/PvdO family nonheme iron enzyme [Anaerolineales bacterium]
MAKSTEWIGRELSGYTIVELIGSGSMADVYLARQPSMNRWVAIKILSSSLTDDSQFVARFRQESQIVAALEHPHILPVIDYGEIGETPYLVMRYISGGTLQDLTQRAGPLPPADILRYLSEVGRGLDYAHSLGVVHRDVKPKNILLDTRGNSFITDFGLAKIIRGGALTHSGVGMIGTPHYMSPEQGRGQAVDGRSDLYSLGVMLYELLTGRVPFDADSAVGIVMRHINDVVPLVTQANPDLPRGLDVVLARALAKNPADRFQSSQEMAEAVAEAYGTTLVAGPALAKPVGETPPHGTPAARPGSRVGARSAVKPARWPVRWPLAATLAGLVFLAGLGAWGRGLLNASPGATPPPTTATAAAPTQPIAPVPSQTAARPQVTPPPVAPTQPPASAASPSPAGVSTVTVPVASTVSAQDGMELIFIPAGVFKLGASDSDPDAKEDEKPQLEVYLDAFWIDRTEVTVAQFADFVRATGYRTDAETGVDDGQNGARAGGVIFVGNDPVFAKDASWLLPEGPGVRSAEERPFGPVVQVSWNDAQAYCQWAGRRLPTEAEWDRAARGTTGRRYAWGEQLTQPDQANFCDKNCPATWRNATVDDSASRTANVGAYPGGASLEGGFDFSGNVWEWVADWYDFRGYYRFPTANPPGVEAGTERVVRGGSWMDTVDRVRASARNKLTPASRNNFTGFRCAVSQP